MSIQVDTPEIQIWLVKTTGLANGSPYRGASASIDGSDITELLGDAGTVRTVKGLDGQSGGFAISFADGAERQVADTAYAVIEPMDMIEIRMARTALTAYGAGALPLVMRGFVSQVQRVEQIGQDGTPQRVVVVKGQDETKIWWNHGLMPEQVYTQNGGYLDRFRLQAATGIAREYMRVSDFMSELVNVINGKVAEMNGFSGTSIPSFGIEASVPEGMVSPGLIAPFKGPFWQLAELVADRPWNELFVESREAGPVVVFRPAPYRHLDGGLIMPGAAEPGTFERDVLHVVSWDASRSDARVANFFWTQPASAQLDTAAGTNVAALRQGMTETFDHPNSALAIFGARKMEVQTRLMPDALYQPPINYPPGQRMAQIGEANTWHHHRAEQLRDCNLDNAVWEELTLVMQGHESFRPGRYIRIVRGQDFGVPGIVTEGYISRVAHTFAPLRTFTTTLSVERSDGFVNRDRMAASPMWAEGRRGVYYD